MKAIVFAALLLGACAAPKMIDTGRVAIVESASLPAPTSADLSDTVRIRPIGPFDTVVVEVVGISELSRDVIVDSGGTIALPVAGVVIANGKTSVELAEEIRARLAQRAVRNPEVIVNVKSTVSQTIVVDGEVRKPGVYAVAGKMTMLRAIARAEGTGEFADAKRVVVLRTVDNKRMAALYDVRAIRLGAYEDPEVYPSDTIIVGESASRRVLPTLMQAGSLLLTPLVYILSR